MPFLNRAEAGKALAKVLIRSYQHSDPIILALPRGGVPVAAEITRALDAPLDLILARKIGVPGHEEVAMGAVVDGAKPTIVRNEDVIAWAGVSEKEFQEVCDRELDEIERRRKLYASGRARMSFHNRVVIVVDDGLATGATAKAALQAVRAQGPRELILAVPVASRESLDDLQGAADRIVCLEAPALFEGVGASYCDFHQVTDAEMSDILARFPPSDGRQSHRLNGIA